MPVEKKTGFNLTYLLVALKGVLLIQGFIAARFRPKEILAVGGHDEREQTLNQLLVEMDGFDPRAGAGDPCLAGDGLVRRSLVVSLASPGAGRAGRTRHAAAFDVTLASRGG